MKMFCELIRFLKNKIKFNNNNYISYKKFLKISIILKLLYSLINYYKPNGLLKRYRT